MKARRDAVTEKKMDWTDVDMELCAINHEQLAQRVQDEVRRMHGLLLWALYHHQGASSPVGQPIRRALGIGEHDHMTPEQIELAKAMGLLHGA